jgi:hypothetical protein
VLLCSANGVFGKHICGVLPRLALLHVCIYTSAPARLTAHPHLSLPLHAIIHSHRDPRYVPGIAGIGEEYSIGLCFTV